MSIKKNESEKKINTSFAVLNEDYLRYNTMSTQEKIAESLEPIAEKVAEKIEKKLETIRENKNK